MKKQGTGLLGHQLSMPASSSPHMLGRPGMTHQGPAHMAPVPLPSPKAPSSAMLGAQGAPKLGYEYGALAALKTASRIGSTMPTGYQFNLDDAWVGSLSPEAQAEAKAKVQALNKWLTENNTAAYAQHPEFARTMVQLSQLRRQQHQLQQQVLPRVTPGK